MVGSRHPTLATPTGRACPLACLILAALACPFSAFAESACPAGIATVPYNPLQPSQIAVAVDINQTGPFKFLLDTGSQVTLLEPSLAAQLHLRGRGSIVVRSVAGNSNADLVQVDRMGVGSNQVDHPMVAVQDLSPLQALNPDVRGVLGQSFVAHFDLLIDRAHRILCFDQSRRMQHALQGERIPVLDPADTQQSLPFTNSVLIPARITGSGGRRTVLKLDCGASVPLLFSARHRPAASIWQAPAIGSPTGVALASTPPRDVEIGQRRLRRIVFLTPAGIDDALPRPAEDGLLPTTLFKRVFISNRDHFVILNPQ